MWQKKKKKQSLYLSFWVRWRPYCHIGIHTKAWVQTARSEYGRQHHIPISYGIDELHRPPSRWMDLPEKDGLPPYPSLPWSPWVFRVSHSIPLYHQLLVYGSRSGNSRCRTGLVATILFSSFHFFKRSLSKHLLNRRWVHNVSYTFWKEGTWERIVFNDLRPFQCKYDECQIQTAKVLNLWWDRTRKDNSNNPHNLCVSFISGFPLMWVRINLDDKPLSSQFAQVLTEKKCLPEYRRVDF